jgi:hypothetical protein
MPNETGLVAYDDKGIAIPNQVQTLDNPTATPTTTPTTGLVTVEGETLSQSQVETLVKAGKNALAIKAEAEALLTRNETAANIAQLIDVMPESDQSLMAQLLSHVVTSRQNGTPATSVDEVLSSVGSKVTLPADMTRIKTTDLDDNSATVLEIADARLVAMERKLDGFASILQNVSNQVTNVSQNAYRMTAAQAASQQLGVEITPALIAEYAAGGVDLLKAIQSGIVTKDNIKGSKAAASATEVKPRVVSAPVSSDLT